MPRYSDMRRAMAFASGRLELPEMSLGSMTVGMGEGASAAMTDS